MESRRSSSFALFELIFLGVIKFDISRLERLELFETQITELINDFEEVESIPGLTQFIFRKGTINYIQPSYFTVFPNLTAIHIQDTNFNITQLTKNMVATTKPLQAVKVTNNTFDGVPLENRRRIIESFIATTKMELNSEFDISNNRLSINRAAVNGLGRLAGLRHLSLRNNQFEDYVTITNAFVSLDSLVTLDLSSTDMIKLVPKIYEFDHDKAILPVVCRVSV